MSNSSWRRRRWNIFKQAYDNDPEFRNELSAIKIQLINGDIVENDETEKLEAIFRKYGIPLDIWQASMYFLANPNLGTNAYLDIVMPPFLFWNAERNVVEPYTQGLTVEELIKTRLEMARDSGEISFDISKINYLELARAIFSYHRTVIEIEPNVGKEELKDLIFDFLDELDEQIKNPDLLRLHGKKLLGSVVPKKDLRIKQEALITKLYKQNESDPYIRMELRDQNLGDIEENNIKQIRHKLGLTKKRQKKNKS